MQEIDPETQDYYILATASRADERTRFIRRFLVFPHRDRICDQASARLNIRPPVFRYERPQADARIEIARKIQI